MNENIATIGLICTITGIVIAYVSFRQGSNKSIKEDASEHTEVRDQLKYISRGVDDIRLDIKAQDRKIDDIKERVTRVEESSKSAHKRLDDIGKEV